MKKKNWPFHIHAQPNRGHETFFVPKENISYQFVIQEQTRKWNSYSHYPILFTLLLCTNARPCVSMVSLDGGEGRGECGLMPQKPVGEGKTLTFCSFGGTHALESSSLAQLFCNTHEHSNGHQRPQRQESIFLSLSFTCVCIQKA